MNLPDPFLDFLNFETKVFGNSFPIANYDSFFIRYGEYRFALDMLTLSPAETILDLGCEANIFMLYSAFKGCRVLGVDINPLVWVKLQQMKRIAEKAAERKLDISFKAEDATRLSLSPDSVDNAIAVSSIEHMFAKDGNGDQMAVASIARVLKPGGRAVVSVPMSNGEPFHETAKGDARFAGPYRLYTPEILQQRLLSHPQLEVLNLSYLANTTPDPRYSNMRFHEFWANLPTQERLKWAWAHPILGSVFNPIVPCEEGHRRVSTLNTALVCFRKK